MRTVCRSQPAATWHPRVGSSSSWGDRPGQVPAALVDTVVRTIVQGDSAFGHGMAAFLFLRFGFPVAQVEIDRRVLAGGVAARFAPMYQRSLALSWAARGAWDSAYVAAGEMLSGGAGERRSPEPLPLRGVRPVARCGRSRRGGDCRPSGSTGCCGSARGRRCRCGARHPGLARRTRRGDRG